MAIRLEDAIGGSKKTNSGGSIYAIPLHAIMLVGASGAVVIHLLLWRSSKVWLNDCLLKDLLCSLPKCR